MTRQEFINNFSSYTIRASMSTNLFPSVFMAQVILESNNGNSILATEYNNYFGIKVSSDWKGDKVILSSGEVVNDKFVKIPGTFRVYKNAYQSFKDRVKFLQANPRYTLVFEAETAEQQCRELQKAGYATDPNYADKLIDLINSYDLKELDKKKRVIKVLKLGIGLTLGISIIILGINLLKS